MKVFSYKGLSVSILLRDEHCPPHAHVNGGAWRARFKFSFWHNDVDLWDVVPVSRQPPSAVLEGLRQSLEQRSQLLRLRNIWWCKLQTACLDNQLWDRKKREVVDVKRVASTSNMIGSSRYEPEMDKTLFKLLGTQEIVEIEL